MLLVINILEHSIRLSNNITFFPGIVFGKLFADQPEEEMERTIKVNLLGVMYLCKMVFEDMVNNYGHIVNMSSTAGIMTGGKIADYCASKFGVRGLTNGM